MSIPRFIVTPSKNVVGETDNFMPLNEDDKLWHKDDDHLNCELCGKEFTLLKRRHHCRNCGKIICEDCFMDHYTRRNQSPYIVCKLCKYCVLDEDEKKCKSYLKNANLVHSKQFIADDFSIDGNEIRVGDTLTITNVTRSKNYASHIFYKARVESFESVGVDSFESVGDNMINLTLIETSDKTHGFHQVGEKVYLQNDDYARAYHKRNNKIPSRITIYLQKNKEYVNQMDEIETKPIPSGYVYVTGVTPPAQGGGYKYRKNKSKRKNKRSVRRRRMSKRSNNRRKNKKVTKRLRKSRRRRRARL